MGLTIGEETDGVKRSMPLANSGARIVIVEVHGEKPRLSGESQVAPFTLMELREVVSPRPKNFGCQMDISLGQKIVSL